MTAPSKDDTVKGNWIERLTAWLKSVAGLVTAVGALITAAVALWASIAPNKGPSDGTATVASPLKPAAEGKAVPHFEEYPAAMPMLGSRPKPRIPDDNAELEYHAPEVLRAAKEEDPNFAGRFIMMTWGCGTECQSHYMIDAATGDIYRAPKSRYGVETRIDSKLLVVNPEGPADGNGSWGPLTREFYVWSDNRFQLIRTDKNFRKMSGG